MPPLKSSLIKPSKSMLFFHIWNANFSVTPINSQMYMTKPKQVQKKLSENTGKTFSVIMPSFTCRGGHIYRNYCILLQNICFWGYIWEVCGMVGSSLFIPSYSLFQFCRILKTNFYIQVYQPHKLFWRSPSPWKDAHSWIWWYPIENI